MMLRTLGQLSIEGSDFRRAKPLLLAAYLSVEGSRPRRYLAELFWPGASDAMNSLSVALSQLRRGVEGAVEADESRAWSHLECDAILLRATFAAGRMDVVDELYGGPFLEGVDLELGEELEEWLYGTRESLASVAREALLRIAESKAGLGRFEEAAKLAERAYYLPGAAEAEPEELVRFHVLLAAGKSPVLAELRRTAQSYGIDLQLTPDEARSSLGSMLVGRERELALLNSLAPGDWAWLRGEAGMGKTAILRQLEGSYLPARSGLPYATLEPLLGSDLGEGESVLLRKLMGRSETLLLDDWEQMDRESQLLLGKLRSLRPRLTVIVAARRPAALPVDLQLVLGPLEGSELNGYPEAWERTGGLPELVEAFLRDESLEVALERQLGRLDEESRQVYLALALLEESNPALVRRALALSGSAMGGALQALQVAALIEPSGTVRARQSALQYLESRPALMGPLALRVAREVEGTAAFPLFELSRAFWEPRDEEAAAAAYHAWAEELLRRGFARRAANVLADAPTSQKTAILLAHALEQTGQFKEALESLEGVPESQLVSALKSNLYWRLGKPKEATAAAQVGLEGGTEARAEALNTLGVIARSQQDYETAEEMTRRAAALWRTLGNHVRWVGALNNLGIVRTLRGEPGERAFREALEAAGKSGLLQARTLLNAGWAYEQENQLIEAEEAYRKAASQAAEAGVTEVAAWAWNNLGVLHHKQSRSDQAREAYEQALALAQRAGEQRILGMVMANLAELGEDRGAWEEALRILENAGHGTLAESFRADLPAGHVFRDVDNSELKV